MLVGLHDPRNWEDMLFVRMFGGNNVYLQFRLLRKHGNIMWRY
jgi:hypothetical protein